MLLYQSLYSLNIVFTLCYYTAIILPLHVYYAAIMLPLQVYYAIIMLLLILKVYFKRICC